MNLNLECTARVCKDSIKALIKETVERQTGRAVESVEFEVRSVTTGYYHREHEVVVFDGAIVRFKKD
jgi:uncharacterized alkaline shock family protein YloU